MTSDENHQAVAIVGTNAVRHAMNDWKVLSMCCKDGTPELIVCAAHVHYLPANAVSTSPSADWIFPTKHIQEQLLCLDISSFSLDKPLPGLLKIYIGMPVILKHNNISTELGITNGASGIIRKIDTKIDANGLTYCTGALVEFPDSNVQLSGLPPKYFPIKVKTWKCTTTVVDESSKKMHIVFYRQQLPLQPGFALTGVSAQGKTMSVVFCELHAGQYQVYVSASRATSQEGLFIAKPVSLHDLNEPPLPLNLWFEHRNFQQLEHNTMVKWGYIQGPMVQVQDSEYELGQKGSVEYKYLFALGKSGTTSASKHKRNAAGNDSRKKRQRLVSEQDLEQVASTHAMTADYRFSSLASVSQKKVSVFKKPTSSSQHTNLDMHPLLLFHFQSTASLHPTALLEIPVPFASVFMHYVLRMVVYFGNGNFNCRLVLNNNSCCGYDGTNVGGQLEFGQDTDAGTSQPELNPGSPSPIPLPTTDEHPNSNNSDTSGDDDDFNALTALFSDTNDLETTVNNVCDHVYSKYTPPRLLLSNFGMTWKARLFQMFPATFPTGLPGRLVAQMVLLGFSMRRISFRRTCSPVAFAMEATTGGHKIGDYFDLNVFDNQITLKNFSKTRLCTYLRSLPTIDTNGVGYNHAELEVITHSNLRFDRFGGFLSVVFDKFLSQNKELDEDLYPDGGVQNNGWVRLLGGYYSLPLVSDFMFTNVPRALSAAVPMTAADIRAEMYRLEKECNLAAFRCDLTCERKGLYRELACTVNLGQVRFTIHKIYDRQGEIIHPVEYKDNMPVGTWVAVEVQPIFSSWDMSRALKDSNTTKKNPGRYSQLHYAIEKKKKIEQDIKERQLAEQTHARDRTVASQ
ncbi:hypothetical protein BT96DRAFT_940545 [Gymnopus androsaceus JB14]|uniref:Uncharacterized protein n=1 Tax=Gymnopus androsaceus JB14 TaxID=1447944 RepID=A0A6A4HII6_9AGAR|nr:hypothetical protein BT96DRAFT_940545 [Gymnopus androsaceus JB14]